MIILTFLCTILYMNNTESWGHRYILMSMCFHPAHELSGRENETVWPVCLVVESWSLFPHIIMQDSLGMKFPGGNTVPDMSGGNTVPAYRTRYMLYMVETAFSYRRHFVLKKVWRLVWKLYTYGFYILLGGLKQKLGITWRRPFFKMATKCNIPLS